MSARTCCHLRCQRIASRAGTPQWGPCILLWCYTLASLSRSGHPGEKGDGQFSFNEASLKTTATKQKVVKNKIHTVSSPHGRREFQSIVLCLVLLNNSNTVSEQETRLIQFDQLFRRADHVCGHSCQLSIGLTWTSWPCVSKQVLAVHE